MTSRTTEQGELTELILACADGFQAALSQREAAAALASKILERAELRVHRHPVYTDADLAGCVAYYCNDLATRHAFVTLVAVHPELRGQGVARSLLTECISSVRDRRFRQIRLRVLRRNKGAISLYQSLGFVCSETTEADLEMTLLLDDARAGEAGSTA